MEQLRDIFRSLSSLDQKHTSSVSVLERHGYNPGKFEIQGFETTTGRY